MVVPVLAAAASSWGVLMGIAPVLQIRRMLRERSSRDVSLGYFMILLAGFLLWISYGMAAENLALIIPNSVAFLVGTALVTVALRLRHQKLGCSAPINSVSRPEATTARIERAPQPAGGRQMPATGATEFAAPRYPLRPNPSSIVRSTL